MFKLCQQLLSSLKIRLMLSLLLMVVIVLPTVGLIIINAYQQHMNSSINNELSAYSYSILAVAEVENNQLLMPELLVESQFNVSQSGLYALISTASGDLKQPLWTSQSLLTLSLPDEQYSLSTGQNRFEVIRLNEQDHFIYSYAVSFTDDEDNHFPINLHIIKDKQSYQQQINDFKYQLWLGLMALMLVIFILQLIWLAWTLKPLSQLGKEIIAIEQGKAEQLTGSYPQELAQVTEQLNQLLNTEKKQRVRYRNALSDLAHSLKTPLAVLQAQAELSASSQEQIDRINQTIEHQLKRAQSAGQASWLVGINISELTEKLLNSLAKIYQDKAIALSYKPASQVSFKGDESDYLELLGNLLDNAYKAAKKDIKLTIIQQQQALEIIVEDDGIGVNEQEKALILQRGMRADTYQQGHGVGLAIVRDLVQSYQGQLQIERSTLLGGAKFILSLPNR